jgi:aspartate/methionine/tyrosine aminotransferase
MLERTILLDGFSKTFAMTGWRLGYAAVPEPLVEPLTRLFINCHSCTAPATQLAGVAALTGPWDAVEAMMAEFRTRRALVVDGLNAIPGVSCIEPAGAFYAFPDISGTGMPARDLQNRLLEEAGVAMLAGTAFGAYGEGYMRVSYANSQENIREALGIMADLLAAG